MSSQEAKMTRSRHHRHRTWYERESVVRKVMAAELQVAKTRRHRSWYKRKSRIRKLRTAAILVLLLGLVVACTLGVVAYLNKADSPVAGPAVPNGPANSPGEPPKPPPTLDLRLGGD